MCKGNENSATENDTQKSYWHIPTITAVFIVIFAMLIIALVYFIGVAKIPVNVTDEGLVITFLGVIATFVVVGNFMQTAEIKRETIEKLHEYKRVLNDRNKEVKTEINSDMDAKVKILDETITTTKEKIEDDFREKLAKAIENQENKVTIAMSINNQAQQSRIKDTKEELGARISMLANMQADATSATTRTMLDFVSLVIMMNDAQKKLFQEFLKRLPAYEIRYKKGGNTSVELRDNGFGFIRLYDLKVRKFLDEGDYKKIESISSVRINNMGQIEEVLNIYNLYNKILAFTMQSAKISGDKIDIEGSFADHKQEQGDNNDNEGNFQE